MVNQEQKKNVLKTQLNIIQQKNGEQMIQQFTLIQEEKDGIMNVRLILLIQYPKKEQ